MGDTDVTIGVSCQQWRYKVIGDKKLGIRQGPSVDALPSTSGHLRSGAVFLVSERVFCKEDGRTYLKLADGRGWTYDRSAKDPTKVVVMELSPGQEKALFVGTKASGMEKEKAKRKSKKGDMEENV